MPKLLFIRYKRAKNILEGGEVVSRRNLEALEAVLGKENVEVIYIHDEKARKKSRIVGAWFFLRNYFFGLTPGRTAAIVDKAMDYDYLWIDRSVFGIIGRKARQAGYKGKIICFFHNIETIFFNAKLPKWLVGRHVVLRCARRNDIYCCRVADTIVTLTKRDSDYLFKHYGRGADFIAPVMFRDRYAKDIYPLGNISSKPLCVFLGSFFPANVQGVEWFVKEVYPNVDVNLKIVGKGMDKLKFLGREWLPPEIEIVTDAPQLEPYFIQADIMVIPIFKGSGMKVKTCESLIVGRGLGGIRPGLRTRRRPLQLGLGVHQAHQGTHQGSNSAIQRIFQGSLPEQVLRRPGSRIVQGYSGLDSIHGISHLPPGVFPLLGGYAF